jgi:hypothetical protein
MADQKFPIKLKEIYICPSEFARIFDELNEGLIHPLPVPSCGIVIEYSGSKYEKIDRLSIVERMTSSPH